MSSTEDISYSKGTCPITSNSSEFPPKTLEDFKNYLSKRKAACYRKKKDFSASYDRWNQLERLMPIAALSGIVFGYALASRGYSVIGAALVMSAVTINIWPHTSEKYRDRMRRYDNRVLSIAKIEKEIGSGYKPHPDISDEDLLKFHVDNFFTSERLSHEFKK